MTAMAQTGLGDMQRAVGYTTGDAITEDAAGIGQEGTYKLGAILMPAQLQAYKGCDVVGIRFALGMDMSRSAVFLNTVNPSTNSISADVISQSARYPSKGWNNIFFNGDKKFRITGDEGILFGFEYTESASMVANDQGAICLNGENISGNAFYIYGNFGQGEGWYSSNTGTLCVQLIVDVSSMPANDICFTTLTTGHKYKKAGEQIDFFAAYDNAGRNNLQTVDLTVLIDGQETASYTSTNDKGEQTMTLEKLVSIPETMAIGQHSFTVRLDKINGEVPAEARSISENFVVYNQSLGRQKHYVEQYMSQKSTFNQYTDKIMFDIAANERVCLVNMYNTDGTLAVADAAPYIDRYAYTFPCFTVDRSYYPGENYVAYDVNDYAAVVPEIMISVINEMVAEQDYYPAFATVNITPEYNAESRQLDITVDGDLIDGVKQLFAGDAVLTVLLTENNVKASQLYTDALGRTKTNTSYAHNNVLRQFVSDAQGDAIDLDATSYSKTYSLQLPQKYKADDMEVIAFVSKGTSGGVTEHNLPEFDVTNANSVKLHDIISGISDIAVTAPSASPSAVYNLHGQRVSSNSRGIVIIGGKKFMK